MRNLGQARRWHRGVGVIVFLAAANFAFGQASGFNFTICFGPKIVDVPEIKRLSDAGFGLAYQHDLEPRFGMALDLFMHGDGYASSYDAIASAKYFTSDNDATAFYIGSFLGVQSLKATVTEYSSTPGIQATRNQFSRLQFPVGLRAGVRGGMGGYFGELFAQAGYAIGNGAFYIQDGKQYKSSPLYLTIGFSFLGFGWEHG